MGAEEIRILLRVAQTTELRIVPTMRSAVSRAVVEIFTTASSPQRGVTSRGRSEWTAFGKCLQDADKKVCTTPDGKVDASCTTGAHVDRFAQCTIDSSRPSPNLAQRTP